MVNNMETEKQAFLLEVNDALNGPGQEKVEAFKFCIKQHILYNARTGCKAITVLSTNNIVYAGTYSISLGLDGLGKISDYFREEGFQVTVQNNGSVTIAW